MERVNPNFCDAFPGTSTAPVWLLGKRHDSTVTDGPDGTPSATWPTLLDDFSTTPWFTYRKEFPAIAPTSLTSDQGWGCMIRSGQMMLARGFLSHYVGREMKPEALPSRYYTVMRWFADTPSGYCPFSLHHLAVLGNAEYDKKIGEWFGPNTIAFALQRIFERSFPDKKTVALHVANDSCLFVNEVAKVCAKEDSDDWKSLLLVVPLRLGLDKLNEIYIPALARLFEMPQSLGLIGGVGRHSLYLVGMQENSALYLDPHTVQKAVKMDKDFPAETFSCQALAKTPLDKLDPSLALGFYCKTKDEFESLHGGLDKLFKECTPLFSIMESESSAVHTHSGDVDADEDDIIEF